MGEFGVPSREEEATREMMRCLDCREVKDDVEYRTTSDRTDGKAFLRCESCWEKREAKSARNLELMSPVRPKWFDESYAGERWDDEY